MANDAQSSTPDQPFFDPFIFFTTAGFAVLVVTASIINLEATNWILKAIQGWVVSQFAWLFVISVTGFLVFAIYLCISKYGRIRLGPNDSTPDFTRMTWFAMLFSAGMGIGLVFYGVAEPVLHYVNPPSESPMTPAAARDAMRITMFHWGFHAWGIYAIMGMALAYFHHRLGKPLAIRCTLEPFLGRYTNRSAGKFVDILAVLGTLFGLATSLGLGASQINAGLDRLFGVDTAVTAQLWIIGIITLCATVSLVTGLDKGIRRLSELNMLLALLLLVFVLVLGPTAYLLRGLPDHLGSYLQRVAGMSLYTDAFRVSTWQASWTLFYWAWWISWAPFVGTFIARISRGRTIREFVLGVLLVPTLAGVVWFGIFGGAALHIELLAGGGISEAVKANVATAIFALLDHFPFAQLTSLIAVILIAVFFVTSSDSGSFVVDMLTSGGHPSPPVWQRIFWAFTEGTLAAILLLVGGLGALQAGAISTGLPFCIVLIFISFSLMRSLRGESVPNTLPPTLP